MEHGLTVALIHAELMSQVVGRGRRLQKGPGLAVWQAMFDDYMARHDLMPLGALISRFRSVAPVEPALDALLDETLRRRNFLVHAFFRENAVEFVHPAGRAKMIDELHQDYELFTRTDDAVQATVAQIASRLGIDAEAQRQQVEEITRALLAEAKARAASG